MKISSLNPMRLFQAENSKYGVGNLDDSEHTHIVKLIDDRFEKSLDWMVDYRNQWRTNEKVLDGKIHSLPINYNEMLTQLKPNLTLSIVESMRPIMEQAIPSADIMPQDFNDLSWSAAIGPRVMEITEDGDLEDELGEQGYNMLIYGAGLMTGFPKIGYLPGIYAKDAIDEHGLQAGEFAIQRGKEILKIKNVDELAAIDKKDKIVTFNPLSAKDTPIFLGYQFDALDLRTWFPAPKSTGVDIFKNSRYQILAFPTPINDMKAEYPHVANKLEPEGDMEDYMSFRTLQNEDKDRQGDFILKKIMFWYDPLDKKKYPNGRMSVVGNGVLCDNRPLWSNLPLDPRRHKPGAPLHLVKNYGSKYRLVGKGEPEILLPVIKSLHEVLSSIADNIREAGNAGWIGTEAYMNSAHQKPQGVTGEINYVPKLGDLMRKEIRVLPPETLTFVELLLNFPQILTGMEDAARGHPNSPDQSGRAIRELSAKAENKMTSKTRRTFKPVVKTITKDIIWGLQRFDTETRSIKKNLIDSMGNPTFVDYDPNAKDENGNSFKDSKFETNIQPGLPFPKGTAAYEEMLFGYLQAGIIDGEYFIMHSQLKDKELLLIKYRENQEATAMIQEVEMKNKLFPKFQALVQDALRIYKSDMPELFFDAHNPILPNLIDMIKTFPDYMETNEWQALPTDYKSAILHGAFVVQPQNQNATSGI